MITLGIGGSNHDFSAAIVKDGQIIVAIEDERIQRVKRGSRHWRARPCEASVEYCLEATNLTLEDIDGIYVNSDIETPEPFWEKYEHKIVSHHLNHASAAFYSSSFEQAAVMVIDGRGEKLSSNENKGLFETISVGLGKDIDLALDTFQSGEQQLATSNWQYVTTNSIGWFYRTVTEIIGFDAGQEGKTMALASYGSPIFEGLLLDFVDYDDEGRFYFDPYCNAWDALASEIKNSNNAFRVRADIAASCQKILEDSVVRIGKYTKKKTGENYLCYGGGVALNGVANHRLRQEVGFKDIYIYPASGDNGLAVGAALYGQHSELKVSRRRNPQKDLISVAYGGKVYTEDESLLALNSFPVSYVKAMQPEKEIADRLICGQVVALFQLGSETGPRALGHRSILADPSKVSIRDKLNQIKRRESFRPFAPIVLEEEAQRYFELDAQSPFMLEIAPVKQELETLIRGVSHIDRSARIQTIPENGDPLIRALLIELLKMGKPPVVINTSFNLNGKPIVETPHDAIEAFIKMDLDALFLDGYWVEKHSPWIERKNQ